MENLAESIRNQTSFALRLTKHVFNTEDEDPDVDNRNLVLSPLSIHVVLGLIATGSKGEPLNQLLSLLGSQSIEELNSLASGLFASVLVDGSHLGGPETTFANSVWIQDYLPLKQAFKDVIDNVYGASLKQVDFVHKAEEIIGEVNSWAEKETKGLIKDILPAESLNSSSRFVLANALHFKGAWEYEFFPASTWQSDFHLLNGISVRVPFMTNDGYQRVGAYNGFKVLVLPYEKEKDKRRLSMYIILPDAKDGLPALIERVASEPGFLDRHLPDEYVSVRRFWIPKFKISFGFKALDVLKGLGVVAPLLLTKMVDSPESSSLKVSEIYHKSFIEIDEAGTEAGAATATAELSYSCGSPPGPRIDFVADHPFLFLLREEVTGVVFFIGRVLDPSYSP